MTLELNSKIELGELDVFSHIGIKHLNDHAVSDLGGFVYPGLAYGSSFSVVEDGAEIPLPDIPQDARTGNCIELAMYYVLHLLNKNPTYTEIDNVVRNATRTSEVIDILMVSYLFEMMDFEYYGKYKIDPKNRRHPKVTEIYDKTEEVIDDKITQMVTDILEGNVLIASIHQAEMYGYNESDDMHAVVIHGFKINESGVPIFLGIDHNLTGNRSIEYPARHLIQMAELDYLAIGYERFNYLQAS
jgi:hypothetical protein